MPLARFREALGRPAYEDEDILLYRGDSTQMMKHIPPRSVPLTVTSPPYNIGKEYEEIIEANDYVQWVESWARQIHHITSDNGSLWLNIGYMPLNGKAKALPISYLLWDRIPFFLIQEIVWNYGAGVAGKLFFSPRNEKFLWYVKNEKDYVFNLDDVRDPNVKYPSQKKNGKLRCNPGGKNPTDVWQIAKVTSGKDRSSKERTAHPAQFPLELVNRVILASSQLGDVVFDPFCGSGSLLEAAARAGRKAIGIEINEKYISVAAERIRSYRKSICEKNSQNDLFVQKTTDISL